MILSISGLILRIPAKAPRGLFGEAASWRRSVHTEWGGPSCPLPGSLLPPPPWSLVLGKPTPTHVGRLRGWPWAWSHLPGPLCQARFQMPASAQVRWGFFTSDPATPLGCGFGFRVQTGLHSSEEARSRLIKAPKSTRRQPAVPASATRGASRSG